jgi:hypothetical protein
MDLLPSLNNGAETLERGVVVVISRQQRLLGTGQASMPDLLITAQTEGTPRKPLTKAVGARQNPGSNEKGQSAIPVNGYFEVRTRLGDQDSCANN